MNYDDIRPYFDGEIPDAMRRIAALDVAPQIVRFVYPDSPVRLKLKHLSDVAICVPADLSYTIQEFHLPIYHMLCLAAENEFFGE